jgi:hypothetical protein
MKKITFISLAVLAISFLVSSCGAPAQIGNNNNKRVKLELNEVQEWANNAPTGVLRAAGAYTDHEIGYANMNSAVMARAELSNQISVKITTAVELYRGKYDVSSASAEGVKRAKDAEGKDENYIKQLSQNLVQGAKVRKTEQYQLANGEIEAWSGVEIEIETIIAQIEKQAKVEQLINDEQRVKIEYNRDQFKASLEEAFNE